MKTAGPSVAANLRSVRAAIDAAALSVGRAPSEVRLLAVSKTKSVPLVREAVQAGQRAFGENYVQEALGKIGELPEAEWHFIGGLQSNKVRQVVGLFRLLHSVDREKLAREISMECANQGVEQGILIQVNVGGEPSKGGIALEQAPDFVRSIQDLPGLKIEGLMCLPPLTEDEAVGRGYFRETRLCAKKIRRDVLSGEKAARFRELSMGTTHDFTWAIAEGATWVRIGTAIFGAR